MIDISHIRNFSIIAHVDHGKSTLADRLLERTGVINKRSIRPQFLDKMELERERGITIKAQAVRMEYTQPELGQYIFNMIDTPGHVDFSYEVSRSLSACEGALLVVDAVQGVEAQTLANTYLAVEGSLELIIVINKIDLPGSRPKEVIKEIENLIGIDARGAILASAKESIGIENILDAIVKHIHPPKGSLNKPLRALIFDSWFDNYRGVILLVRLVDGEIFKNSMFEIASTGAQYEIEELGVFSPDPTPKAKLSAGEVGYIIPGIKNLKETRVGDTILNPKDKALPLSGFKKVLPNVYAGIYPVRSEDFKKLKQAIDKLSLNDASFTAEAETSRALGLGFRFGFLGLLHMEIVQERLEREYKLDLITTSPTVEYLIHLKGGTAKEISNPSDMPYLHTIDTIEEPYLLTTIYTPEEFVGSIMTLCEERRATQKDIAYPSASRVVLKYEIPLSEIILDFHDRLKSISRGYASMDYEPIGYKHSDLVRLDIMVNRELVDAFSLLVSREKAYQRARMLVDKLKGIIPKQLFDVAIQATIGSRVIARQSISPLRKNVTAKCYGGDITRKRKLLEKQKEGKKRLKMIGNVEIPQEAFLAVLKMEK